MNKDIKVLIVPDVHGRSFWEEPIKKVLSESDAKIIFLGDYHDPYPNEWINEDYMEYSIKGFKEIIELKKNNKERITLLLGNHDCTYAVSRDICDCRRDRKNNNELVKLFKDNKVLFQLADEITVNDKHFIFSHAGISKTYAESIFGETVDENNVVNLFNNAWITDNDEVIGSLGIYDKYRGWGGYSFGSLVWADATEWVNKDQEGYGISIMGHTQLENAIKFEDIYYMLDARKCFYIDSKGNVLDYETNEGISNYE